PGTWFEKQKSGGRSRHGEVALRPVPLSPFGKPPQRRQDQHSRRMLTIDEWRALLAEGRSGTPSMRLLPGQLHRAKINSYATENTMKKRVEKRKPAGELRPEYDLSRLKGGVRGKYLARFQAGTNLVLLSPDVAEYFADEQSVDAALRALIRVARGPFRRAR